MGSHWGARLLPAVVLEGIEGARRRRCAMTVALVVLLGPVGSVLLLLGGLESLSRWSRLESRGILAVGLVAWGLLLAGAVRAMRRKRKVARSAVALRLRDDPASIVAVEVFLGRMRLELDGEKEFSSAFYLPKSSWPWSYTVVLRFIECRPTARLVVSPRQMPALLSFLFETLVGANPGCLWSGRPIRSLMAATPMENAPPRTRPTRFVERIPARIVHDPRRL